MTRVIPGYVSRSSEEVHEKNEIEVNRRAGRREKSPFLSSAPPFS